MDLFVKAFHYAIPPVEARQPLTLTALLLPVLLHLVSIHLLLRYPASNKLATRLRQFVLLPLIVLFGTRAAYAYTMVDKPCAPGWSGTPRFGGQQQLRIFFPMYWTFYSAIKACEWAFHPRPRLQRPLMDLQRRLDKKMELKSALKPDQTTKREDGTEDALPTYLPGTKIPLELDLLCSLRGVGWEWGLPYSPFAPPPTPFELVAHDPEAVRAWRADRVRYLTSRVYTLLITLFLVDVIDGIHKSEPIWGVLAGEGAPIIGGVVQSEGMDITALSMPAQLFLSWTTGSFIVIAMAFLHTIPSILFVLPSVLWPDNTFIAKYTWSDPAHWSPPMADLRWWAVGNVRGLWSRHWHQVLRRCFLVGAYWPTKRVLTALLGGGGGSSEDRRVRGAQAQPATNGQHGKTDEDHVKNGTVQTASNGRQGRRHRTRVDVARKMFIHAMCALSTFALSGVMHESFLVAAARTPSERSLWRIVGLGPVEGMPVRADGRVDRGGGMLVFFLVQGLACVGEEVVEALLGVRIGGLLGSVWTMVCLVLSAMPFARAWWSFGIANGAQINPLTRKVIDGIAARVLAAAPS